MTREQVVVPIERYREKMQKAVVLGVADPAYYQQVMEAIRGGAKSVRLTQLEGGDYLQEFLKESCEH